MSTATTSRPADVRVAAGPSAFTGLRHTLLLTARHLRAARRVPMFLLMNLLQPMIWLLLFGQLFRSVVNIPGFSAGGSYLEFLTPGIVMMMALSGSAWAGTAYIQDMERGVMDQLLTSPTSRSALMVSTLVYQSILTVLQTVVVLGVAWLGGARFGGGVGGVLVMLLGAALLTAAFSALSNAAALLTRDQTVLIGLSQLLTIPLMFLSSALMDTHLSAGWVAGVARFNPFEWAVVVGREALSRTPDVGTIVLHLGLLAGLAVVMTGVATRAFRSYQRTT